jgi:hypothetical protein
MQRDDPGKKGYDPAKKKNMNKCYEIFRKWRQCQPDQEFVFWLFEFSLWSKERTSLKLLSCDDLTRYFWIVQCFETNFSRFGTLDQDLVASRTTERFFNRIIEEGGKIQNKYEPIGRDLLRQMSVVLLRKETLILLRWQRILSWISWVAAGMTSSFILSPSDSKYSRTGGLCADLSGRCFWDSVEQTLAMDLSMEKVSAQKLLYLFADYTRLVWLSFLHVRSLSNLWQREETFDFWRRRWSLDLPNLALACDPVRKMNSTLRPLVSTDNNCSPSVPGSTNPQWFHWDWIWNRIATRFSVLPAAISSLLWWEVVMIIKMPAQSSNTYLLMLLLLLSLLSLPQQVERSKSIHQQPTDEGPHLPTKPSLSFLRPEWNSDHPFHARVAPLGWSWILSEWKVMGIRKMSSRNLLMRHAQHQLTIPTPAMAATIQPSNQCSGSECLSEIQEDPGASPLVKQYGALGPVTDMTDFTSVFCLPLIVESRIYQTQDTRHSCNAELSSRQRD